MNDKELWEEYRKGRKQSEHSCPSSDELAAYIDGRVEGEKRDAIESHLSRCDSCLDTVLILKRMERERGAPLHSGSEKKAPIRPANRPQAAFIRSYLPKIAASFLVIVSSYLGMHAGMRTFESTDASMELFVEEDLQPIVSDLDPFDLFESDSGGV